MILVATQTFAPAKGGMEAYMTGLAEQLAQAGLNTIVFADGKNKSYVPQAPYGLRRFGGWRPLRRLRKRRAIRTLIANEPLEGLFCDSWKSLEAVPREVNAPLVVLAHGAEYPVTPSARKRKRIVQALARATAIVANSRFTADAVRPYLAQADDPRLLIIHPPILPLPSPGTKATREMRSLLQGKKPVLATVARLEARKGIDRVIIALPRLIDNHPSLVYAVGGRGDDRNRLEALAKEKGVANHVLFLGGLSDDQKAALLSAADLFVMPVRREGRSVEGFGISYIEAGWYGVPSLGGLGSGAEDAVEDEKTGLLVDGDNQTEVTTTLQTLLDDKDLRKRLGLAARRRVQKELLWERTLPKFLALIGRGA
ncbi:MAG: glycosyltransferase family 4 protein [Alphaproteobacteria bacterium]|nr:glycosyltransferase family 4 protein [Alphaproteobacteria bacterium]